MVTSLLQYTPPTDDDLDLAESTWEPINYGRFTNQLAPDIIKIDRET